MLVCVRRHADQNLNIKYGYVRMRANGTVLVTDVSARPLLSMLRACM